MTTVIFFNQSHTLPVPVLLFKLIFSLDGLGFKCNLVARETMSYENITAISGKQM